MALPSASLIPVLALVLAGCDKPPAWPPGTVVAVDDVPITLDEVDRASVWIERIDPKSSGPQLRRLALTNVSLPRALAEAMAPKERARAEREAHEALAELRGGTWSAPLGADGAIGEFVSGTWKDLSISSWGLAADLPVGEWSEPLDDAGHFLIVKLLERTHLPHTAALHVRVDVLAFPYLPEDADIEGAKDRHRLTIVDPAWREIVPERIQYRMGAR